MARVICENCGRRISDTDERCLYCNAINNNRIRPKVSSEPTSIVETSSIIKSYTVNSTEIEESPIVFTKKDAAKIDVQSIEDLPPHIQEMVQSALKQEFRTKSQKKKTKRTIVFVLSLFVVLLVLFLIGLFGLIIAGESGPEWGYYTANNQLFYYEGYHYNEETDREGYFWWRYEPVVGDWYVYSCTEAPYYIEGLDSKTSLWGDEAEDLIGITYDEFNIEYSKTYIDGGHHYSPSTGYYFYDNTIYFYLYELFQSEIRGGWYYYDTESEAWEYLCSYEDKAIIGDNLYYYPHGFWIGDNDFAWRNSGKVLECPSFLETDVYKLYQEYRQTILNNN